MNCAGQPFVLLAEHTSCAESPPCTHIQCYSDIQCLIAGSLSPVIAGCRAPDRDLFCICPSPSPALWRFSRRMSNANISSTTLAPTDSGGLSSGQVAGIVCGIFAFVILLATGGYFLVRYLRDRRKNHGEYRPQFEELHHAKDLPYLQPPAVEGLI